MDIDVALRRIVNEAAPTRLSSVDAAVFEHIDRNDLGARDLPTSFQLVAVTAALMLGLTAGIFPSRSSDAEHLADFAGVARFAPSTLLAGS